MFVEWEWGFRPVVKFTRKKNGVIISTLSLIILEIWEIWRGISTWWCCSPSNVMKLLDSITFLLLVVEFPAIFVNLLWFSFQTSAFWSTPRDVGDCSRVFFGTSTFVNFRSLSCFRSVINNCLFTVVYVCSYLLCLFSGKGLGHSPPTKITICTPNRPRKTNATAVFRVLQIFVIFHKNIIDNNDKAKKIVKFRKFTNISISKNSLYKKIGYQFFFNKETADKNPKFFTTTNTPWKLE